ncbi:MAG TPA: winged helix-turn-helix domain-containing protein [Actinotalea sp.]|nr:winged helix-turn-helix domain-containing protein [Actinotalea sp.]
MTAPAIRAHAPEPTGFVLYVEYEPGALGAAPDELRRTAATLRELASEWHPSARTRAVLSGPAPERRGAQAPAAPTGPPAQRRPRSLRSRLAAIPDAPDVVLDLAAGRASVDGVPLDLTPTEFALLSHLVSARGRAVGRGELLTAVWAGRGPVPGERTVDVHIRRLRLVPALAGLIATVHGVGYRVPSGAGIRVVP